MRRIQFTPDLLPSDVTGVSIYNQEPRDFEFKPGAIFANVVLGDEINRASPKTQSALLECMEERQVTVDGVTYHLEPPFIVVATQNPIEMEGTYPLPEAQRDRFLARVSMGYPGTGAEMAMLTATAASSPLATWQPVTDGATIARLIDIVRDVWVSAAVKQYVVDIARPPGRPPTCGWAPHRGPRCTCCGPPGAARRSRAATTCCRTTSRARRPGPRAPPAPQRRRPAGPSHRPGRPRRGPSPRARSAVQPLTA